MFGWILDLFLYSFSLDIYGELIMNITLIAVLYLYVFVVSFLLIYLVGWLYKMKGRNTLGKLVSTVLVYFYALFSFFTICLSYRFLGLGEDGMLHSIIGIILCLAAFLFAIAKYGKNAHKRLSLRFKKRK